MGRVTIQEIAKEMGMSRNTVAKALKNDEAVARSTREKVLAKAHEMGYAKIAPGILEEVQKKPGNSRGAVPRVVILMNNYEKDDFWNEVIMGISEKIKENRGSCLIEFVTEDEERNAIIPEIVREEDILGIICLTVFGERFQSEIDSLGKAVVVLDAPIHSLRQRPKHDVILIEGKYSVYEMTSTLIQKGCKNLLFLGDIQYCESIRDRWAGFMEAVREGGEGIGYDYPKVSVKYHFYKKEEVKAFLEELEVFPDAIVCANDLTAIYVMMYCRENGIQIPKRVAITGFDNEKEGRLLNPTLTTVHADNRKIGNRIAEQLLWRMHNTDRNIEVVTLATKPKYRASSEWGREKS